MKQPQEGCPQNQTGPDRVKNTLLCRLFFHVCFHGLTAPSSPARQAIEVCSSLSWGLGLSCTLEFNHPLPVCFARVVGRFAGGHPVQRSLAFQAQAGGTKVASCGVTGDVCFDSERSLKSMAILAVPQVPALVLATCGAWQRARHTRSRRL